MGEWEANEEGFGFPEIETLKAHLALFKQAKAELLESSPVEISGEKWHGAEIDYNRAVKNAENYLNVTAKAQEELNLAEFYRQLLEHLLPAVRYFRIAEIEALNNSTHFEDCIYHLREIELLAERQGELSFSGILQHSPDAEIRDQETENEPLHPMLSTAWPVLLAFKEALIEKLSSSAVCREIDSHISQMVQTLVCYDKALEEQSEARVRLQAKLEAIEELLDIFAGEKGLVSNIAKLHTQDPASGRECMASLQGLVEIIETYGSTENKKTARNILTTYLPEKRPNLEAQPNTMEKIRREVFALAAETGNENLESWITPYFRDSPDKAHKPLPENEALDLVEGEVKTMLRSHNNALLGKMRNRAEHIISAIQDYRRSSPK